MARYDLILEVEVTKDGRVQHGSRAWWNNLKEDALAALTDLAKQSGKVCEQNANKKGPLQLRLISVIVPHDGAKDIQTKPCVISGITEEGRVAIEKSWLAIGNTLVGMGEARLKAKGLG